MLYDLHITAPCIRYDYPLVRVCCAVQGDSGSPANVDVTGQSDWVIVGLNSWGTGNRCAAATNAFVRITWFLDWIEARVPGLPGVKPPQPTHATL